MKAVERKVFCVALEMTFYFLSLSEERKKERKKRKKVQRCPSYLTCLKVNARLSEVIRLFGVKGLPYTKPQHGYGGH